MSEALVLALDERFGEPVDAYVNGAQTWLRDEGAEELTLEWRLHPVARFRKPEGVTTHELFADVALALGTGRPPIAPPHALWGGLECFCAYDDELEPVALAELATAVLGVAPDAAGLVDHDAVGDEWERTGGAVSIVDLLLAQLEQLG